MIYDDFPSQRSHSWKYLSFGPDGKLYVPVGAPGNVVNVDCQPSRYQPDTYSAIFRLNVDGSGYEQVVSGVRNTVGFDWHPVTDELWFTDNGRDNIGGNNTDVTNNFPPDELNVVREEGTHFGYPYRHGIDIRDPQMADDDCRNRDYVL